MGFGKKLGAWVLDAAVVAGAVAIAWKLQKPSPPTAPPVESCPSGWASGPPRPVMVGGVWPKGAPWRWWRDVLIDTYEAMGKDRLLAVAAGVVFYALLAMVPAITAFVSFYGLFATPGTVQDHLSLLTDVLPPASIEILREQIVRIGSQPGGLSIGAIGGLLIALWSANAGVKALIDALNVIEGRDEGRSFIRLNLLSLSMTLGAIAFLLLSIGAVVAFPLVMSTFGLKPFTGTATWLVRWPILFAVMVGALAVFYRLGPSGLKTHRRVADAGCGRRGARLARGIGGAVVLFVELRRLQRHLRLARRSHRPDDVDVAVDDCGADGRRTRRDDRAESISAHRSVDVRRLS